MRSFNFGWGGWGVCELRPTTWAPCSHGRNSQEPNLTLGSRACSACCREQCVGPLRRAWSPKLQLARRPFDVSGAVDHLSGMLPRGRELRPTADRAQSVHLDVLYLSRCSHFQLHRSRVGSLAELSSPPGTLCLALQEPILFLEIWYSGGQAYSA